MKKIMILVLLAFASFGMTQGWTHTVNYAVFNHGFTMELGLPWDRAAVTELPIAGCWAESDPPFLGRDWTFWCYSVPGQGQADAFKVADTIRAAITDTGMVGNQFGVFDNSGPLLEGSFRYSSPPKRLRYWVFDAPSGIRVSFAEETRPGEMATPVEPLPEPEPVEAP